MCSNLTRFKDVSRIIRDLSITNPWFKFNIWIDEADKSLKIWKKYVSSWREEYENVLDIYLITATSARVYEHFGKANNFYVDKKTFEETYQYFNGCLFKHCDDLMNPHNYIEFMMDGLQDDLLAGSVMFIPALKRRISHKYVKDLALKRGYACIVLNGDGYRLFLDPDDPDNSEDFKTKNKKIKKEIKFLLAEIYKKYKLKNRVLVITGFICIQRGVTISSEEMFISHAIFYNIDNPDEAYQLVGRLCGHSRGYRVHPPTVCCTTAFRNLVLNREQLPALLANMGEVVSYEEIEPHISQTSKKRKIETINDVQTYDFPLDNFSTGEKWKEQIGMIETTHHIKFGPKFLNYIKDDYLENGFYTGDVRGTRRVYSLQELMNAPVTGLGIKNPWRLTICYLDITKSQTGRLFLNFSEEMFQKKAAKIAEKNNSCLNL